MFLARNLTRPSFISSHKLHFPTTFKMSTTGAMYMSESLKAANAQPYSSMEGKLDPMLLQALKDMNFDFMTPVQSKVLSELPSLKSDWSVIVSPT